MNRREFFFTATAVPFLKPQHPPLKFKYLNETISIPVNVSAEEWEKGMRRIIAEINKMSEINKQLLRNGAQLLSAEVRR